jgi:hypothetical protein
VTLRNGRPVGLFGGCATLPRTASPRRRHHVLRAAVEALLLAALTVAQAAPAAAATSRRADVVANGAWCWFQDPRAVHYVGLHDRTYVGYVTSAGDIEVVSIDNGTGVLTHTVLHPGYQADDHAAPGIAVAPNGSVVVFYSQHSGANMNFRVSTNPEDIGSFGPEMTLPTGSGGYGVTYANPIYLSAEKRTYFFFRGRDYRPNVTSTTDFVHWAPVQSVVFPDQAGAAARPYAKYASNGTDTILLAFDDGHPRDAPTNSVYTLLLQGGVFRGADGRPLATLDPAQATASVHALPVHTRELTPVYDGSGSSGRAWVHSAAIDPTGHPVVAFATFPAAGAPADLDHRYRHARWDGTAWTVTEFADAGGSIDTTGTEPDYSGGMDLVHDDPSTLYVSRQVGAAWHVERWHTPDGGHTFDPPVDLTSDSTVKNVRPVVPWGPSGDVQVLWMSGRYDHWLNGYSTALQMQTAGPSPSTARSSTTATTLPAGQRVTIGSRRLAGWNGAPVPGTVAQLWGTSGTGAPTLRATSVADSGGLVDFPVTQNATTTYEVRWPAAAGWSATSAPPVTVSTTAAALPTAVRISVDRTVVPRGGAVSVGMRVVNAANGAGLGGVPVQLWQSVDGGRTWVLRVALGTDSSGLARAVRNPTTAVIYQARFPGTPAWAASVSGTTTVTMR